MEVVQNVLIQLEVLVHEEEVEGVDHVYQGGRVVVRVQNVEFVALVAVQKLFLPQVGLNHLIHEFYLSNLNVNKI